MTNYIPSNPESQLAQLEALLTDKGYKRSEFTAMVSLYGLWKGQYQMLTNEASITVVIPPIGHDDGFYRFYTFTMDEALCHIKDNASHMMWGTETPLTF